MKFNQLDFEIHIDNLYDKCETPRQVEWLQEQMMSIVEGLAEERIEELEDD